MTTTLGAACRAGPATTPACPRDRADRARRKGSTWRPTPSGSSANGQWPLSARIATSALRKRLALAVCHRHRDVRDRARPTRRGRAGRAARSASACRRPPAPGSSVARYRLSTARVVPASMWSYIRSTNARGSPRGFPWRSADPSRASRGGLEGSPATGSARSSPGSATVVDQAPVLISTALANLSGLPIAHSRPQGPPKSWSTRCARPIPSRVERRARGSARSPRRCS